MSDWQLIIIVVWLESALSGLGWECHQIPPLMPLHRKSRACLILQARVIINWFITKFQLLFHITVEVKLRRVLRIKVSLPHPKRDIWAGKRDLTDTPHLTTDCFLWIALWLTQQLAVCIWIEYHQDVLKVVAFWYETTPDLRYYLNLWISRNFDPNFIFHIFPLSYAYIEIIDY